MRNAVLFLGTCCRAAPFKALSFPISKSCAVAVHAGRSSSHYSLLYLQWNPGINSPFVTKHLRPDTWRIHTAERGWCVRERIRTRVRISDSRLSLKLKQKSTHPPSQLYLFMPSSPQRPHAGKQTQPTHSASHAAVRLLRKSQRPGGDPALHIVKLESTCGI